MNFTRQSFAVAFLVAFSAATLAAQTPSPNQQPANQAPERIAPITPNQIDTRAISNLAPNATTLVQGQKSKQKHSLGVEPGVLPLTVRQDPFLAQQRYGAAPAMAQWRFGHK